MKLIKLKIFLINKNFVKRKVFSAKFKIIFYQKMKVEPKSDEMTDASCSGFDSSDDDTGEVDLSPLEISW